MCSTKCPTEISLSNDLVFSEMFPIQPRESLLDSNSEFEFCVSGSFECESSSADELFFNGVIVPTQNQQRFVKSKRTHQCSSLPPLPPLPPTTENHPKKPEEFVHVVKNSECEKKTGSKSFWGFGRSNSVSFDSRKGSLFALPRSNSTGSVKTQKGKPLMMVDVKTQSSQLLRQHSVSEGKSKSSSSTSAANSYSKLQKSQKKKNHGGFYHGKNLQVNHIFNVKETANIFGLSSLLRGSKEKKSRN